MTASIQAEFVPTAHGRILVVARRPENFSGDCVLLVPPFAEEMNKSRKMMTELAKRLSARGVGTVMPDLFGTGDSEGDFAEATCERWIADLVATDAWVVRQGWSVKSALGLRFGCLLASEYARRGKACGHTVFWQPTLDGARVLEQFLRLRVAATLMQDKKETVADLKSQLEAGKVVDVAGYGIAPELASQMSSLKLMPAAVELGRVSWFEVVRAADAPPPMPSVKASEQLRGEGRLERFEGIVGEPFWTSAEIVQVPALIDATVDVLTRVP